MRSVLRKNQRDELKRDIAEGERRLQNPQVQDKPGTAHQIRRLKKQLETQSPVELQPNEKDVLAARIRDLENEIPVGMPSHEEMRKAPDGAIGRHMAWEKRNKTKILEWKNAKVTLDPDSEDPDLANVERLRPVRSMLNMDSALIPGKSFNFPSEQFQQNYDTVFGEPKPIEPAKPVKKDMRLKENLSLAERKRRGQRAANARKAKDAKAAERALAAEASQSQHAESPQPAA